MNDSNTGSVLGVVYFALVGMAFFFFLGFVSRLKVRNSEINTRECTIACPGNVESIKVEDTCYCKLGQSPSSENNK